MPHNSVANMLGRGKFGPSSRELAPILYAHLLFPPDSTILPQQCCQAPNISSSRPEVALAWAPKWRVAGWVKTSG